jgi:uncharacterized protein
VSSTTKRKPAARTTRRGGGKTARPAASARKPKAPAPRKRPSRTARAEQPLGMGVGDGFAVRRLKVPPRAGAKKGAVREIGWAAFGDISRTLAARIGESFLPDAVLGIAKGGVFVGGALAAALGAEFFPVRLEKRRRDHVSPARGPAPLRGIAADGRHAIEALPQLPELRGKRVLVVDDVAASGATLARARALARKAGGREVKTAVLVVRHAGARPDWAAIETDDLVLFAWDYHLDEAGGGGIDPGEVGV